MIASLVFAQLCAAVPSEGVVVSEGRAAFGAVIAAHAGAVVVGWQETGPRPARAAGGPPEWRPRESYARELDPATLAPRSAARRIDAESVFYAHMTGLGASASPAGDGAAIASCQCFGGSGRIGCGVTAFGTFPALAVGQEQGGCSDGIALGTAGPSSVIAFTNAAALQLASSSARRGRGTREGFTADRMALARADGDRAVLAWRSGTWDPAQPASAQEIFAMTVDAEGRQGSQAVLLSDGFPRLGAPALAWVGGAALVPFARASNARAPWQLALATWIPGRRHTLASLRTGRAPAVAPSIVPARGDGCAVLSWTEGSGRRTVVRAGRVCGGSLATGSITQVSRVGAEAGESELASDGRNVFVVWQEIPAARGAPAELRVARLACE